MKTTRNNLKWIGTLCAMMMAAQLWAQNRMDEARMQRDIEVAENVLSTLLKQQLQMKNQFFPLEVEGVYNEGYGVMFRLPTESFWMLPGLRNVEFEWREVELDWRDGEREIERDMREMERDLRDKERDFRNREREFRDEERMIRKGGEKSGETIEIESIKGADGPVRVITRNRRAPGRPARDSASAANYHQKIVQAAKDFLADYGDLISQLKPNERITITNRHENQRFWFPGLNDAKRTYVSVEAVKGDLTQLRQGKITRDQLLAKLVVVNSEFVGDPDPDLELFSSILNRLYKPDLSRTFFTQENIYYERLKDFGAIFHMQVFSGNVVQNESDGKPGERFYHMPTLKLRNIDQATRDAKVKELYPQFEAELKENLLEYGRTIKSLKPDERLTVNVKLTKCEGCNIPASLEVSVTGRVLSDYAGGKMQKSDALAKVAVKKGPAQ
jgi:hypothetical protein